MRRSSSRESFLPFTHKKANGNTNIVQAKISAKSSGNKLQSVLHNWSAGRQDLKTLVVYVYSGSDPEYEDNLRFFLRTAVKEDDGCDYVIVIQTGANLTEFSNRPALPTNARYLEHPNKCFDWGTSGWVFENGHANPNIYRYFVFLNSSGRGPYLPAYLPPGFHWTQALTNKLTASVKLVGPSINCGGGYGHPPISHVQTYALATDRQGLKALADAGTVFHCWETMAETVIHSELGASIVIKEAGFSIDSLMLRYQGLDWRDSQSNACNGGLNPIQWGFYDGIDVNPLEVLFIKVKKSMHEAGWGHVQQAVKYDLWSQQALAANMSTMTVEQKQESSM
ncbi:hypothetical protein WJX73_002333 [Symbiochloris irregularis]|uniref:Uncharacterized protein n=1 Tax=Symbiochloris irregularis TaxID=706552 RepID=A0AAW1P6P9_9CHLO